ILDRSTEPRLQGADLCLQVDELDRAGFRRVHAAFARVGRSITGTPRCAIDSLMATTTSTTRSPSLPSLSAGRCAVTDWRKCWHWFLSGSVAGMAGLSTSPLWGPSLTSPKV